MKKLLAMIVALTFAALSVPSFAAKHEGAPMKEGEKNEQKADKKKAKKATKAKKDEKKAEEKK